MPVGLLTTFFIPFRHLKLCFTYPQFSVVQIAINLTPYPEMALHFITNKHQWTYRGRTWIHNLESGVTHRLLRKTMLVVLFCVSPKNLFFNPVLPSPSSPMNAKSGRSFIFMSRPILLLALFLTESYQSYPSDCSGHHWRMISVWYSVIFCRLITFASSHLLNLSKPHVFHTGVPVGNLCQKSLNTLSNLYR